MASRCRDLAVRDSLALARICCRRRGRSGACGEWSGHRAWRKCGASDRGSGAHLYLRPQDLLADVAPGGLEGDLRLQSAARQRHVQLRSAYRGGSVDTELGDIRILDYVICEYGGHAGQSMMIVDGQPDRGGTAQGISGTALYEQMSAADAHGQPLGSTLGGLSARWAPPKFTGTAHRAHGNAIAIVDVLAEGHRWWRRIGPPAAIANAVNDALAPLGVELTELPITPHRVLAALLARA